MGCESGARKSVVSVVPPTAITAGYSITFFVTAFPATPFRATDAVGTEHSTIGINSEKAKRNRKSMPAYHAFAVRLVMLIFAIMRVYEVVLSPPQPRLPPSQIRIAAVRWVCLLLGRCTSLVQLFNRVLESSR